MVHLRLHNLCAECNIPEEAEGKIWDLMADILVNEHKNRLIFTRHIDQIILCAIYAISRTFNIEMGFKDLIGYYRKQPQVGIHADAITRNIPLVDGKRGDIIDFNNTIFVPMVKNKIYPIVQVNCFAYPRNFSQLFLIFYRRIRQMIV